MRLLNSLPPYNLFGLEGSSYNGARVVALPIPYDATSTYVPGSRFGPKAIIEASRNMELYSIEAKADASRIGIYTTEELAPDLSSPKSMTERISKEVSLLINDKKIPLLIGGEHTIAIGAVKAFARQGRKFTVLHFDAHSDSRDELYNTRYCHACVMARIKELCGDYYSIGVRSIDEESAKRNDKRILYMEKIRKLGIKKAAEVLAKNSGKDVYMTFDFDVIDPSEMPSTGTPEPGGLHFSELVEMLGIVLKNKNLIGMDFTELCPIPGVVAPDFLAAKLIYSALGFAYKK